ncbi:hypothetical protein [Microcella alkaliphila]|uniref:Restriction endonuclease n=1 Tax=Microcella alkaliphila TaxID=279828 RepID=A0A0U4NW49_9MICO|nr:hypothetical protein [Microcella alkaliphila]BAU32483.1 uncharacterized protein MalAC0309_1632 [Microcella alkaliphila]
MTASAATGLAVAALVGALSTLRPTYTNEADLQRAIADHLTERGYTVQREVELSGADRIDIYLPVLRFGIEVKIKGNLSTVERQLTRYAASPAIDALILVTTRASHTRIPHTINDIPVAVHPLLEAGL